ncbi:hypothetical protein RMB03_17385 [Acinetobacter sp. V91_7]|uniref:hypothetical protein n=1 Tax=unclassified Acinetobacter TaxID=196816 RepID=UPI00287DD639|nr:MULTISPECIES: hypothetical protein [unclassified Acinetobacter]MDS7935670.1 hypothetical protein [Acinetobacter sp. V91_4B]MDS7964722.1 hypothetical protein [Acinetobacter sp. V91_7]MDS8025583.1 hypothetical protein [Acinetobacter sp. V91_13]
MPLRAGALAETINISTVASAVLKTGLASYCELDTVLSLEDALNIIEADQVAKYNEQIWESIRNEYR